MSKNRKKKNCLINGSTSANDYSKKERNNKTDCMAAP